MSIMRPTVLWECNATPVDRFYSLYRITQHVHISVYDAGIQIPPKIYFSKKKRKSKFLQPLFPSALIDLLKKRYTKDLLEDRTLTETYFTRSNL